MRSDTADNEPMLKDSFIWRAKRTMLLLAYYGFAQYLPLSYRPGGPSAKRIRGALAKNLLASAGRNINIESHVDFGDGHRVSLGEGSGIGARSRVEAAVIEEGVIIGPELMALCRNHRFAEPGVWIGLQGYADPEPVRIGRGSWIGARVTILPGVSIGEFCVIGAGSVVTRDVPDYAVAVGNPARVIRTWGCAPDSAEVQRT